MPVIMHVFGIEWVIIIIFGYDMFVILWILCGATVEIPPRQLVVAHPRPWRPRSRSSPGSFQQIWNCASCRDD